MEVCFSQKYIICSFVVFSDTTFLQQSNKTINFDLYQQQQVHNPKSGSPNQATTERQSNIGGQLIVVM